MTIEDVQNLCNRQLADAGAELASDIETATAIECSIDSGLSCDSLIAKYKKAIDRYKEKEKRILAEWETNR